LKVASGTVGAQMECLNVLVVDDSSTVRLILGSILTKLGHKVVSTASTGIEACVAYSACNPDVVIMDITMPEMDGIEATEKIFSSHPDARIIVATTSATKDVVLRARTAGARAYILKPINPDRLRATLKIVMRDELHILDS
jgi:two-component system, chemotaxis family, chemotaxis protein CheY